MTAPTPPADATPAPEGTPAAPVETPAPPAPPSPAQMPQQTAPAPSPAPEGDQDGGDDTGDDPVSAAERKARREAKNLRDRLQAEAQAREALAQQVAELAPLASKASEMEQTLAKLAAVFNPQTDEPVDPAKLAEQLAAEKAAAEESAAAALAERDAQIRELTVKAALPTAMAKASADPDLTLAVLTASGALSKLDPTAESFTADLESAVKAAVESNPKLKVAPVAVRSGAEIPGRSGGSDQVTRDQLAKMTPEQIEKARVEGRLKNLLSGIG